MHRVAPPDRYGAVDDGRGGGEGGGVARRTAPRRRSAVGSSRPHRGGSAAHPGRPPPARGATAGGGGGAKELRHEIAADPFASEGRGTLTPSDLYLHPTASRLSWVYCERGMGSTTPNPIADALALHPQTVGALAGRPWAPPPLSPLAHAPSAKARGRQRKAARRAQRDARVDHRDTHARFRRARAHSECGFLLRGSDGRACWDVRRLELLRAAQQRSYTLAQLERDHPLNFAAGLFDAAFLAAVAEPAAAEPTAAEPTAAEPATALATAAATAASIIADVDRGRALCHDRRVTEHQPAHTDPYALPLGDAFIAELRARYGERCIDEVLPLPLAARPPVDYIDEALPLPPAARPPVDPDESEFDSTHDGYDDEFVFDSTHDEYDDEYALDLGGY